MFKKILVPLDGSMLSEKVLPHAIRLANRLNSTLLVLRAVELPLFKRETPENEIDAVKNAEDYLAEVANVLLNPQVEPHLDPERLQTMVVYGDPVKEITELAPFENVGLIMMSTHGRSGLSRLVAGSIASQVVHQSTLPVLLIRPYEQRNDQLLVETLCGIGERNVHCFDEVGGRVLLTLDGTELAEVAIDPAIELAKQLDATLYLLRVVHPYTPVVYGEMAGLGMDRQEISASLQQAIDEGFLYLDEVEKLVQAQGVPCEKMVRYGVSSLEIIEYVQQVEPTLIVMATHARGEVGHLLMGSIAEEVMRQSHMPVMMVPPSLAVKAAQPVTGGQANEVRAPSGRSHGFEPAFETGSQENLEKHDLVSPLD